MAPLFARAAGLPRRLRYHLAMTTGRMTGWFLRLLGRGATAMPGKLALTLAPDLLAALTAGRQVFLVTGTNGKTTTVRMLCQILQEQGYTVVTNPSGANLDSGLTTTILLNLRSMKKALAAGEKMAFVFEIDEAFFARLASQLNPDICVVTNFFRDQLDRFGELRHTRDLIARGLAGSQAKAVLCADDSLCASLGRDHSQPTAYFGMAASSMSRSADNAVLESPFCSFCGTRYQHERLAYGHLGVYACPNCGYKRPQPDLCFIPSVLTEHNSELECVYDGSSVHLTCPVPGLYNAYNAAAALLAALMAGLPLIDSAQALEHTDAAFGRMERFNVGDKAVCLILVKNPVGMERALDFVNSATDVGQIMLLLNANDPDGRDVSWIWDVHFEENMLPGRIGVSGMRRHDLALRLYYAGKKPGELMVEADALNLFDQMLSSCPDGRCLYLLPNYTAMLTLRAGLVKRYHLRDFWR
ncbi:MAG: DUF1727 domain-containing protein [Ruminococcaceae bacterium]|jgi:UDP-N-acetylmuramyl tripeptide synthase|nr:DUF1727 domain-containing protein [Oscillospiraceae bacterium]